MQASANFSRIRQLEHLQREVYRVQNAMYEFMKFNPGQCVYRPASCPASKCREEGNPFLTMSCLPRSPKSCTKGKVRQALRNGFVPEYIAFLFRQLPARHLPLLLAIPMPLPGGRVWWDRRQQSKTWVGTGPESAEQSFVKLRVKQLRCETICVFFKQTFCFNLDDPKSI